MLTSVSIHALTRVKETALAHYQQRVASLRSKAKLDIIATLTEPTGPFWKAQMQEPAASRVNAVLETIHEGGALVAGHRYGPPVVHYVAACRELVAIEAELRLLRGMGPHGSVVWLDDAEARRFISQSGLEA